MTTSISLLRKTGMLSLILLVGHAMLFAQDEKATVIKSTIESHRYVFKAQTASPTSGRTRQLTPEYMLVVGVDSIVADLPYFGRAYSAPVNTTGGGINFTSVRFNYTATLDKKNRWQIVIKTKDVTDSQEMFLTVFENGTASLNVRSVNRQPITFYGYITGR
jgi:Domain of unknown function (DUF4251)